MKAPELSHYFVGASAGGVKSSCNVDRKFGCCWTISAGGGGGTTGHDATTTGAWIDGDAHPDSASANAIT